MKFSRFTESIAKEIGRVNDDKAAIRELEIARKRLDIIKSICKGYMRGNGYVVAFQEALAYSQLAPVVSLDFVPGWPRQEEYRMKLDAATPQNFWGTLATEALTTLGFKDDEVNDNALSIIADRVIEACRRESAAHLPGSLDARLLLPLSPDTFSLAFRARS